MLTKSQLTEFREQLDQEQATLQERMLTLDRRLARDDHYNEAEDLGDSATQVFNKEEILFERNRLIDHLEEIEEALNRIKVGTYGISEVSGEPIPLERLRAMPTAKTLVNERPGPANNR
jgi:RNA polymerase-binding transcription factor DksA